MSHFYGMITKSCRRHAPTACGTQSTGLITEAMSYSGKIVVLLSYDEKTQRDIYNIYERPHLGEGVTKHIASGILGEQHGS
jgi:hypothetical protein